MTTDEHIQNLNRVLGAKNIEIQNQIKRLEELGEERKSIVYAIKQLMELEKQECAVDVGGEVAE